MRHSSWATPFPCACANRQHRLLQPGLETVLQGKYLPGTGGARLACRREWASPSSCVRGSVRVPGTSQPSSPGVPHSRHHRVRGSPGISSATASPRPSGSYREQSEGCPVPAQYRPCFWKRQQASPWMSHTAVPNRGTAAASSPTHPARPPVGKTPPYLGNFRKFEATTTPGISK